MMIQGIFNPTHVLREFFSCEYAFELNWWELTEEEPKVAIRVAHEKGVWMLAKFQNKKIVDAFEITDTFNFPAITFSPPNGLIRGFLAAKIEDAKDLNVSALRKEVAGALTELVHFWGGDLNEIRAINVVQPGRNATLTETGEFQLRPRMEDWKK